jgi:thiol-disulfide isomerase/thioredoxin
MIRACIACFLVIVGVTSILLALAAGSGASPPPGAGQADSGASAAVPAAWLDRLPREDRQFLDDLVGYAPPAFPDTLEWAGGAAPGWESLRGRVIVLQSWTSRTEAGRLALERATRAVMRRERDDLQLLAVHTPEGADGAAAYLERHKPAGLIAIDPSGAFCDALGVYKRPVNILMDRSGAVRFAGLNASGLGEAIEQLLAEPHNPEVRPAPRATPGVPAAGTTTFPPPNPSVGHARNLQGQRAPQFKVQQWITGQPPLAGRVLVLDFWATWCGPCRQSIPHMNALARTFGGEAAFIGISNENSGAFQGGLQKHRLTLQSFEYALALDPAGTMQQYMGIVGIPHCAVVSSDGIVRWQGHPAALTEEIVGRIIAANRAASGRGARDPRRRWQSA